MVAEMEELRCPLCDSEIEGLSCTGCGRDLDEIRKEYQKLERDKRRALAMALRQQRRKVIEPCDRISLAMRRSVIDALEKYHREWIGDRRDRPFKGAIVETAILEYLARKGVENLPSMPRSRRER